MAQQNNLKDAIIVGYMEHLAPALENVLQRFGELPPDNEKKAPKFLTDFHELVNTRLNGWLQDKNPDEQQLVFTTLNEYMSYQVASYLHTHPKAAATVARAKNAIAPDSAALAPAAQQVSTAAAAPVLAAPAATPAAQTAGKDRGKRLKVLRNIVRAGGTILSAFFSSQPPKIVADVCNLTEFALGVIFGVAKGTIQKLRENSQLAQQLQKVKGEVTNGYLADIAPKLSNAFERYDEILATPGSHPLLADLNHAVADKMQQWASGKTNEEQQLISKTFSALLHSQTASTLAGNPQLAQRIDEDRTLLQAFGIPTETIHPEIATPKEWTPEEALNAVKEDGNNLKSVPEQLVTAPLCELAVAGENGKGEALQHVPEKLKTPVLCETAMLQNPAQAFPHVPDSVKTPQMCDKAVSATGENLQHVPKDNISRELCETAVKSFGKSFAYVPQELRDASLCLTAVRMDGTNLQHVPENLKTKKLCAEAQKSTTQNIQPFLPEKFAPAVKAKPSKQLQAAMEASNGHRQPSATKQQAVPPPPDSAPLPDISDDPFLRVADSAVVPEPHEALPPAVAEKAKPSKSLQTALAQINAGKVAPVQQAHKTAAMKIK
jgi:hypothetical protein